MGIEQRILANRDARRRPAQVLEQPAEERLEDVLILAEIFRDDENVHAPSPASPSVSNRMASSIQSDV